MVTSASVSTALIAICSKMETEPILPPANEVNIMFSQVSVKFGGEGVPM